MSCGEAVLKPTSKVKSRPAAPSSAAGQATDASPEPRRASSTFAPAPLHVDQRPQTAGEMGAKKRRRASTPLDVANQKTDGDFVAAYLAAGCVPPWSTCLFVAGSQYLTAIPLLAAPLAGHHGKQVGRIRKRAKDTA